MNQDNNTEPDKRWTQLIGSFSDDQMAAVHLIFYTFLHTQLIGGLKQLKTPEVLNYLKRALDFIRYAYDNTEPSQELSLSGNVATYSMFNIFQDMLSPEPKHKTQKMALYFGMLGQIATKCIDLLGDKTFREYFDGLTIEDNGRIRSKKVLGLITQCLSNLNMEDYSDEAQDWDDDSVGEEEEGSLDFLVVLNEDYWERVRPLLEEMGDEVAMVFHVITLYLCTKYLEPKLYSKYQKAVLKAVYAFKGNSNQRLKEFNLKCTDDAFEKLKDKLHNLIEEGLYDYNHSTRKMEIFTLSTNCGLSIVLYEITDPKACELLQEIALNQDNIYTAEAIDEYAREFYHLGKLAFNDLMKELKEEFGDLKGYPYDNVLGVFPNDKPIQEADVESLADVFSKGFDMTDLEHKLVFHLLLEEIMHTHLPYELSSKYTETVQNTVEVYMSDRDVDEKKAHCTNSDKAFVEAYKLIHQAMRDSMKGDQTLALKVAAVITTIPYCLEEARGMEKDAVKSVLTGLTLDAETGKYSSQIIKDNANRFLLASCNQVNESILDNCKDKN